VKISCPAVVIQRTKKEFKTKNLLKIFENFLNQFKILNFRGKLSISSLLWFYPHGKYNLALR